MKNISLECYCPQTSCRRKIQALNAHFFTEQNAEIVMSLNNWPSLETILDIPLLNIYIRNISIRHQYIMAYQSMIALGRVLCCEKWVVRDWLRRQIELSNNNVDKYKSITYKGYSMLGFLEQMPVTTYGLMDFYLIEGRVFKL